MKEKLSVTLDSRLVAYLDGLPGDSRSGKLEAVLHRFKQVADDVRLRRALASRAAETDEDEAWRRTMEADQWRP